LSVMVFINFSPLISPMFVWPGKYDVGIYTKDFSWKKNDPNLLNFKEKKI
jgi:hypothetical protein